MVNLHPFCLADSLSHKEVGRTPMRLKLNPDAGIYLIPYENASLLVDLSCCTVLWVLVLVPFPFWESVLVFDLDGHYLCQISVEDNRTAYWLVILQLDYQQLRVDLQ